jgi:hypothetical protein
MSEQDALVAAPRAASLRNRLPRKTWLGGSYYVAVRVVNPAIIRDVVGEDADGCWIESLAKVVEGGPAGTIYVKSTLSLAEKWDTYWHELQHAVLDVMGWDAKQRRKE